MILTYLTRSKNYVKSEAVRTIFCCPKSLLALVVLVAISTGSLSAFSASLRVFGVDLPCLLQV